jgi:type I restriction enzyme S subunit
MGQITATPGYQKTDIGLLPNSWVVKPLGEIAEVRSGIAKNANTKVTQPILVHYLRVANVQDGFLDLSDVSQIEISRSNLQRFSVLPGDVLMNEGGDLDKLGRGAIWDGAFEPCVHQNHVFVVRCGPDVCSVYLNTWSSSDAARRYFLVAGKQTTNLASISKTALSQLPVAVPPRSEQHRIAEALRDVDALLTGMDRLIAKKRDLKQAVMQQLLTGKTRLPGFDGNWSATRLENLFRFSGGHSASRAKLSTEGHRYLHYGDIHGASKTSIDTMSDSQKIPRLDIPLKRVSPDSLLDDGDVVFVDASEDDEGTTKHVVVSNAERLPFIAGLHTIVAKALTNELSHQYRHYCFKTAAVRKQFLFYAVGTKVSGISKKNIAKVTIPFPAVSEQTEISSILSDMDQELAIIESRREKARSLKQAMMQELLTGRIRLV